MKNLCHYGLILMLIIGFSACNNQPDKKNSGKTATTPEYQLKSYYKRLQRTGANIPAVLHLVKYQSAVPNKSAAGTDRYRGTFISGDSSVPLHVTGHVKADSSIQLVIYDHYTPMDTLTGRFKDGIFKGTRTDTAGKHTDFIFNENYPIGSFHFTVATHQDTLSLDSVSADAPKAATDLMTLWPGKDIDSAVRNLILDTICRAFFGVNKRYTSADKLLKAVSDSFLQRYKNVTTDFLKQGGTLRPSFNWNAMAHIDLTCNIDGKVSLIYTQYQYMGGAHGLQSTFCLVVDVENNKILQLSDLFKPGYEKTLQQALEEEFRKQYNIPEGESLGGESGLLFDAHLPVTSNFYITKEGVGFIYNPYEVAPYVVGKINLFLPFSRLKDLSKK